MLQVFEQARSQMLAQPPPSPQVSFFMCHHLSGLCLTLFCCMSFTAKWVTHFARTIRRRDCCNRIHSPRATRRLVIMPLRALSNLAGSSLSGPACNFLLQTLHARHVCRVQTYGHTSQHIGDNHQQGSTLHSIGRSFTHGQIWHLSRWSDESILRVSSCFLTASD
jgi:hypothetical protein